MGDLRGERLRGERLRGERDLRLGRGDLVRLLAPGDVRLAGDLRLAGLDLLAGDLVCDDSALVLSRETDMRGLSPTVATTRLSLSVLASPLLAFSLSLLSLASLPVSNLSLEPLSLLSLSLGLLALALLSLGGSIGFLFLSSLGLLFLSASLGDVCLGLIPLGLVLGAFLSAEAGGGLTFFSTALSFLGLSHVMTLSCNLCVFSLAIALSASLSVPIVIRPKHLASLALGFITTLALMTLP